MTIQVKNKLITSVKHQAKDREKQLLELKLVFKHKAQMMSKQVSTLTNLVKTEQQKAGLIAIQAKELNNMYELVEDHFNDLLTEISKLKSQHHRELALLKKHTEDLKYNCNNTREESEVCLDFD